MKRLPPPSPLGDNGRTNPVLLCSATMTDTLIHCPECGTEIPISEVLGTQIRAEMEKRLRYRLLDSLSNSSMSLSRYFPSNSGER